MSFSGTQCLFKKPLLVESLKGKLFLHLITSMDKLSRARVGQFRPYPIPFPTTLPYPYPSPLLTTKPFHTLPYPNLPYPTSTIQYHTLPYSYPTTISYPMNLASLPFKRRFCLAFVFFLYAINQFEQKVGWLID